MEALVEDQNCLLEVVYKGTITGGAASWGSANAESSVEYKIDGTGITGGHVLFSKQLGASTLGNFAATGNLAQNIATYDPLGLDVDGANPRSLAIVRFRLEDEAA